jgi:hypothetical protein
MDTIGIEAPRDARRAGRGTAVAAVAVVAAAALAGGYGLRATTETPDRAATVIARGVPATWQDAVTEANAVKRHANELERGGRIDVRLARVEE